MAQTQVNLGRVRDLITAVNKVSGTGAPGTIDTYGVFTESHPVSGGVPIATFTVINGSAVTAKLNLVTLSGTTANPVSLATLLNRIDEDTIAIEMKHTVTLNPPLTSYLHCVFHKVDADNSQGVYVVNQSTMQLESISSWLTMSNSEYTIYIYSYDSSAPAALDTALNPSSTNAVENQAIAKAVGLGVTATSVNFTVGGSYASDANLVYAIANRLPFFKSSSSLDGVYRFTYSPATGIHFYENISSSADGAVVSIIEFRTTNQTVIDIISNTFATNDDIDSLF